MSALGEAFDASLEHLQALETTYSNAYITQSVIANRLFTRVTGLHHAHLKTYAGRDVYAVLADQRDKIEGLKLQMRQMKKGYERKIARLESKA